VLRLEADVNAGPVKDKARDRIPAVVHVDGTARIQSVHQESNPLYSRLIGDFATASSVPMLINTSLNINEQPTVNSAIERPPHLLLLWVGSAVSRPLPAF
jgi:predicted NodU family carbamoyl transferase